MHKHIPTRLLTATLIATVATAALSADAAAQVIEEVVVTAAKRESTLHELPFSINARSGEDIARSGAVDLEDLSRNVAGLTIQNLGPGQSQVAIRGVSAGQIVRDQPGVKEQVGIYLDESLISLSLFTPDLDLYDLDRVEVLRGPQGTLYGSGSVGGTVRFITRQPDFDQLDGSVEANLNGLADGGAGGHLKGAVNIPINDHLALRATGYHSDYAGWIDARSEGGIREEDVNSSTRSGGRLSLAIAPDDSLTITPRLIYQAIDSAGFNREEVFNLFANPHTTTRPAIQLAEREQYLLRDEGFTDDLLMTDLVVNKRFDRVDLLLTGAHTRRDIEVTRDASALTGSVGVDLGFPDAAVLLPAPLVDTTDIKQFTGEFRLASSHNGPFQWVVGGFRSDLERDYAQELYIPGYDTHTLNFLIGGLDEGQTTADAMDTLVALRNGFGPDRPYQSQLPYDIKQWALFGEVTQAVTDRLSVTAGARWFDFSEERRFYSGGLFSNTDDQVDRTESDGLTPRLLANYTLSDTVNLNAQVSQGFRLGGVNDPLNLPLCEPGDAEIFGSYLDYDDETLWNYEVGLKSRAGATRFNVALFYTDIEDLQVTLDAGSCSSRVVFNMEEAHTLGVEWELSAFPAPGLEVGFAGSFAEAEFDSDVRAANGAILNGLEKGNRLPSVPESQLSATATYTWITGLLGAEEMFVSALLQHVGNRYTQPSDQLEGAGLFLSSLPFGGATGEELTALDLRLASYETLNLSFGVRWQDWEAVLYANNATDENARLSFDRERGGRARLGFRTNRPRTVGLTVRTVF